MCRLSRNSGASTSSNPKGPSRPVVGKLYLSIYLIPYQSYWTRLKYAKLSPVFKTGCRPLLTDPCVNIFVALYLKTWQWPYVKSFTMPNLWLRPSRCLQLAFMKVMSTSLSLLSNHLRSLTTEGQTWQKICVMSRPVFEEPEFNDT
jgi:hypothetical protein